MRVAGVPFCRVAVVGLGVMGGSLARALRGLPEGPEVLGWTPGRDEGDLVRAAGAVDTVASTPSEAARGADLVVLAAPLDACMSLLDTVAHAAPATAVLTDVASLKAPMEEAARHAGVSDRWVGCHPMAGSEASGFGASTPSLYQGATVWITADGSAAAPADRVASMWETLGAHPRRTTAREHDARMVLVSHLPQLASNALARVLERHRVDVSELGPGGRDMTRLAGGSPAMWREILRHAPRGLAPALRDVAELLAEIAAVVDEGSTDDLARLMDGTRAWRERT